MKKCVLSILVILLVSNILYSQDDENKHPMLTDEFVLEVGWFNPTDNVDFGISGTIDLDLEDVDEIDFDEQLGISGGESTFNLHFKWRFSKSNLWYMTGEYFGVVLKKQ